MNETELVFTFLKSIPFCPNLDLFTYTDVEIFFNNPLITPEYISSCFLGAYGPIKAMNYFLTIMSDFDGTYNSISSLQKFKTLCSKVQKLTLEPSLNSLRLLQSNNEKEASLNELKEFSSKRNVIFAQIIAKWWGIYLSILREAFDVHFEKNAEWSGEWFTEEDQSYLQESLKCYEKNYELEIRLHV